MAPSQKRLRQSIRDNCWFWTAPWCHSGALPSSWKATQVMSWFRSCVVNTQSFVLWLEGRLQVVFWLGDFLKDSIGSPSVWVCSRGIMFKHLTTMCCPLWSPQVVPPNSGGLIWKSMYSLPCLWFQCLAVPPALTSLNYSCLRLFC